MIVKIAYSVDARTVDQIRSLLWREQLDNSIFANVKIKLERDEETWIDGGGYDSITLLWKIHGLIMQNRESASELDEYKRFATYLLIEKIEEVGIHSVVGDQEIDGMTAYEIGQLALQRYLDLRPADVDQFVWDMLTSSLAEVDWQEVGERILTELREDRG